MHEDQTDTPIIVGAGPAGLAAARVFVDHGLRPIILDESIRPGGQGTRRITPRLERYRSRIFGDAAAAMIERERREDTVLAACDYRPGTQVWGAMGDELSVVSEGGLATLRYRAAILATGAMDRILPLPGWTLPGAYTLGGSQIALKRDASFIGRTVVFAGSSPLLYLAAAQYLRAGGQVAAVLDTTPISAKLRAFPRMATTGLGTLTEGVRLIRELRRAKVPIHMGVSLDAITGKDRVSGISYASANKQVRWLPCDAVGLGYGLQPEMQLAELMGAKFRFDPAFRQWFTVTEPDGQFAPNAWVAGDGAAIGGAAAAADSGALAAWSILEHQGLATPPKAEIARLIRRVARWRRFQRAMTMAFAPPAGKLSGLPADTILCRCERVSIGNVREAVTNQQGPVEVNRVKAITRCGMGRCQGRLCGGSLGEITAALTGRSLEQAGRLRAQAPIRPLPAGAACTEDDA